MLSWQLIKPQEFQCHHFCILLAWPWFHCAISNSCLNPAFTRTLAPVLGGLNKFKHHCLVGTKGAHRSLGKVLITFPLTAS